MLQQACLSLEAVTDNPLGFRMCVGPVPHNQTCVMLNTSADPVAMMDGLMV